MRFRKLGKLGLTNVSLIGIAICLALLFFMSTSIRSISPNAIAALVVVMVVFALIATRKFYMSGGKSGKTGGSGRIPGENSVVQNHIITVCDDLLDGFRRGAIDEDMYSSLTQTLMVASKLLQGKVLAGEEGQ